MRTGEPEHEARRLLVAIPSGRRRDALADLVVEMASLIAAEAMEIAGPLFWAVLLAGVISDALGG